VWDKLRQALALFPSVVLSWVDSDGYPVSVRISPEPIAGAEVLRFSPPAGLELRAGPASVLGHSHNEQTWNLKSFLARGRLEQDEAGWAFRPLAFIPGTGVGSPLDQLKPTLRLRPTAKRYLKRRGLARPAIPWDNIKRSY
jgi:hypothetical protein